MQIIMFRSHSKLSFPKLILIEYWDLRLCSYLWRQWTLLNVFPSKKFLLES